MSRLLQGVGQPFETLVETITGGGAGGLNVLFETVSFLSDTVAGGADVAYPGTSCQALQTKLLGDFGWAHGILYKRPR